MEGVEISCIEFIRGMDEMSKNRILCKNCDFPLAWCKCRDYKRHFERIITPAKKKFYIKWKFYDIKDKTVAQRCNYTITNYYKTLKAREEALKALIKKGRYIVGVGKRD